MAAAWRARADQTGGLDRKRRQVLDGARRAFLAAGFDGASMGDVAKAAGVSKGTLYTHFDSKEALFEALIAEERSSLAEALFRLDADDPDPRDALRRLGRGYLEALVRPEHVASVRMVIGVAEKLPRVGQAFYRAGPQQGAERLAAWLDRQVAAGRLAIPDTGAAACQFLDLCSASVMKRLMFAVGEAPDAAAIARQVDGAVALFLAAYGVGGAAGQSSVRR